MRRSDLDPPVRLLEPPPLRTSRRERKELGTRRPGGAPGALHHEVLADARHAEPHRRVLFHPKRGWFRRTERAASQYLAVHVYRHVPGMSLWYDAYLKRHLTLARATVELDRLPRAFDGLRVLFVADPHAGAFVSPRRLAETFDRLLAVEPDLLLVGGDWVTSTWREFVTHRRAFERLSAPLGVFGVLGNHDYYGAGAERLPAMIEDTGVRLLRNASVAIERGGERLAIAGVEDPIGGTPDLARALADTVAPVILLSHTPDLLFEAARHRVALMLAGHTHGGQVRIPGLPVLVRQSRYPLDEGRFVYDRTQLVVTRGLGVVGVPVRWACPPEAVLFELRTAPAVPKTP
jgi:predicted MPP superfamily phosphohydrolase